jgi:hypothetical protein
MDHERLRWITSPPTLDAYKIDVRFAETPQGTLATLYAEGRCDRRRGTLWTHTETIEVAPGRYTLNDLVTHISLVCSQDRPISNVGFTRAMTGACWEQPELPF